MTYSVIVVGNTSMEVEVCAITSKLVWVTSSWIVEYTVVVSPRLRVSVTV